jgi:hypothetical protein
MGFTDCIYNATIPGFAVSEFGFHTDQRRWFRIKQESID